jgi:hypothetical protein
MAKMTPLERARQNERLANEALATGNIAAAQAYQANISQQLLQPGKLPGVGNVANRVSTAVNAAVQAANPTPSGSSGGSGGGGTGGGTGGGGGDNTTSPTETEAEKAQRIYYEGLEADRIATNKANREAASSFLRGILSQYNMGSLAGNIEGLVNEWGTNTEVIAEKLRQTDAYKTRFKGLTSLQQRGITDIRNEAEYLDLETNYRQVFREAGMSSFLGDSGTQTEYDSIAKLVGDYSLSVNEVRDRVTDAQRIVAETPQEVRDSFQRYYNVDPATLTAYVLDPTRTANEINKRANAAIIGGLGQQRGLEFGSGVAERIGTFLGGDQNLTGTQAEPILGEIADVQRSTGRLAQLEKGTLTAEETALAQLDLDTEAKRKVKGLQSRERARFGGTGAFGSSALSSSGKV